MAQSTLLPMDGTDDGEGAESNETHPLRSVNGVTENQTNAIVPPGGWNKFHRKKTALPPIELDEYNWRKADNSPSGSIRRKFVFTVPGVMKPEQPREYKLKAFVVLLFFLIIIYISLTYVFHKQQQLNLLQASHGERLHFREESQTLRILSKSKHELLAGELGVYLPSSLIPFKCELNNNQKGRCLEWKHTARMTITYPSKLPDDDCRCYNVFWESMDNDFEPFDCFQMGGAHWFGLGLIQPQAWLIETLNISLQPFVTGSLSSGVYGNALERYWLTSNGVALNVDSSSNLWVSLNASGDQKLCLRSRGMSPEAPHAPLYPVLNYTLCTSSDIRSVHQGVLRRFHRSHRLTPLLRSMMSGVVWMTDGVMNKSDINEEALFTFADHVLDYNLVTASAGVIVIRQGWQTVEGDLTFNKGKFNLNKMSAIRNKGFKLSVAIHPYVSTNSVNYMAELNHRRWIMDSRGRAPALTQWLDLPSAAILDVSNNESQIWFLEHLERLKEAHIDGFYFEGGESSFLPPHYSVTRPFPGADEYARLYAQTAVSSGAAMSISAAANCQNLPVFVSIAPRESSWDDPRGIRSVIPAVLSLGLAGYSFVNPGTVGGEGYHVGKYADEELFIRWLQLAAFLPVVQLPFPPDKYGPSTASAARAIMELRKRLVLPRLLRLADEAAKTGTPIIRPMWWGAANDTIAALVDSQFFVGDDLLVAPVLEPQAKERDVYLPAGLWIRKEPTQVYQGGRWLSFEAALTEVIYFIRVNTTVVHR